MTRVTVAFALLAMLSAATQRAVAFPDFHKAFGAKYVSPGASEELGKAFKAAKCNVCHQGRKKKNMNAYGSLLDELLSKGDRKNNEKIVAALEEVAEKKSIDGDESSPTYGELIAAGKLPVDLETAKKEPDEL